MSRVDIGIVRREIGPAGGGRCFSEIGLAVRLHRAPGSAIRLSFRPRVVLRRAHDACRRGGSGETLWRLRRAATIDVRQSRRGVVIAHRGSLTCWPIGRGEADSAIWIRAELLGRLFVGDLSA